MTPAELDLARALVAAPWWEWRIGMLVRSYPVPGWDDADRVLDERDRGWRRDGSLIPDLTDNPTQGCLMAMLVDVASIEVASALGHYRVSLIVRDEHYTGQSLGEALARALLAVRP